MKGEILSIETTQKIANLEKDNKIYKSRIDKANEYIKNNKYKKMGGYGDNEDEDIEICLFEDDINNIEKLLGGGDDE